MCVGLGAGRLWVQSQLLPFTLAALGKPSTTHVHSLSPGVNGYWSWMVGLCRMINLLAPAMAAWVVYAPQGVEKAPRMNRSENDQEGKV